MEFCTGGDLKTLIKKKRMEEVSFSERVCSVSFFLTDG
jgi:hypothetical protein